MASPLVSLIRQSAGEGIRLLPHQWTTEAALRKQRGMKRRVSRPIQNSKYIFYGVRQHLANMISLEVVLHNCRLLATKHDGKVIGLMY